MARSTDLRWTRRVVQCAMDNTRKASRKKYHILYKTTCLITGRYYLGMHSTDDLQDGYLGSGKVLAFSIKKHGRENHRQEIVEHCANRKLLRIREKELINPAQIKDPLCMNLKVGGGSEIESQVTLAETLQKLSDLKQGSKNPMFGKQRTLAEREKISKTMKGQKQPVARKAKQSETMRLWWQERKNNGALNR